MKYGLRSQWRYLGLLLGGVLAFLRDPSLWIVNGFIDKIVFAGGGLLIGWLAEIGYRYRDRLKFSIRDLFLVTVIVALAVGWRLDRSRLAVERNRHRTLHEWLDRYDKDMALYEGYTNSRRDNLSPEELKLIPTKKLPNSSAPAPNPPKP